jgi:hypothetical protein
MHEIRWSPLKRLSDRKGVSRGRGVYLIGVWDDDLADLGEDAEYFGKDYPTSFRPRYVGMSMSSRCGIAWRLRSHARGKGNRQVKEFINVNGLDTLFYTYSEYPLADLMESHMLGYSNDKFLDWNDKSELMGALNRMAVEGKAPSPICSDHLEPWEQIEEFEDKRQISKDWTTIVNKYPKYKRINESLKKDGLI